MHHSQKMFLFIGVAVILIGIAAFIFIILGSPNTPTAVTPGISPPSPAVAGPNESLGGQIYEKSQNPIQDKVPGLTPAPNPIEKACSNPFD